MSREKGNKKHRRRGQAMVEFSLCLPLLIVIFLGVIETVFIFKSHLTVLQSAREGARVGSTFNCTGATTPTCAQVNKSILATIASDMGSDELPYVTQVEIYNAFNDTITNGTDDIYTPVVTFDAQGNPQVVSDANGPEWNGPATPNWNSRSGVDLNNQTAQLMGVRVTYWHTSKTKFFPAVNLTGLWADTRMRIEPPPTSNGP